MGTSVGSPPMWMACTTGAPHDDEITFWQWQSHGREDRETRGAYTERRGLAWLGGWVAGWLVGRLAGRLAVWLARLLDELANIRCRGTCRRPSVMHCKILLVPVVGSPPCHMS